VGGQKAKLQWLIHTPCPRYRLQSGSFEALSLISEELVHRLTKHFAVPRRNPSLAHRSSQDGGSDPFQIGFKEQLPLEPYFELVDRHFGFRKQMMELKDRLEQAAHQVAPPSSPPLTQCLRLVSCGSKAPSGTIQG
jgi:hypothetical protein